MLYDIEEFQSQKAVSFFRSYYFNKMALQYASKN
jgi:hypothetical protein